jgi:uncharacterized protein (DUF302 family)
MAADGLTTIRSHRGPKETMDRLEAAIKARAMSVFARVDHAAGAAEVGLALLPTAVLIFGNAKAGTPLMQAMQTVGIDLPLKALCGRTQRATRGCPTTIPAGSRTGTGSTERPPRPSAP